MALADPTPAKLPLPGGREGATVRLHPINTAELSMPDAYLHREQGRSAALKTYGLRGGWTRIPIPAFLVEHQSAGPFLVDTGFHPSVAVDPKQNLGRLVERFARGLQMREGQGMPDQLRARGLEPGAIKLVVMTHMHLDHTSAIAEFPAATFVVNATEWQAANEPRGLRRGYIKRHFDHGFDYRTVDFSGADSFATFGRSVDLFGDGSVRLVSTPGHSLGHMSVVLRLKDREALLAGDAIYDMDTLHGYPLPAITADEHLFRRSLKEIQIYAKETPDALIVPGHDFPAWNQLDPVYG